MKSLDVRHFAVLTEGLRSALGGVQLLLLTAILGPDIFGQYSQGFALTGLVMPIALGGATYWLQPYLQKPAVERATASHIVLWSLINLVVTAPLCAFTLGFMSTASFLGNYLVLAAEMAAYSGWTHLVLMQLGLQRGAVYTVATIIMSLARLGAAVLLVLLGQHSLESIGFWLLVTGSVGFVGQLIWMRWRPGDWTMAIRDNRTRAWSFSLIALLESAMDGADKVILGRSLSTQDVGVLAASGRLNNYALVPGRGLEQAVYPKLFVAAEGGHFEELRRTIHHTARRGVLWTGLMAAAVMAGIALTHDWLFSQYHGLVAAMLLLMPRMILRPITFVLGDALYALGLAVNRLLSLSVTVVVYIFALMWAAPRFGIAGVAGVGLACELANLGLFALAIHRHMPLFRAAPIRRAAEDSVVER